MPYRRRRFTRLKGSGRLNDDEASDRYGTNVVPLLMSREELRHGFVGAMQKAYTLDAYFGRVDALFIGDGFKFAPQQHDYWRRHRLAWARRGAGDYLKFLAVALRLLISVKDPALRSRYRRQLWRILHARGAEPQILLIYAIKIAMHYHYTAITKALGEADRGDGVMPDAIRSFSRAGRGRAVEAVS